MIKAIFAKEVQAGDVILLREERLLAVESTWASAPLGYIQFNGPNGVFSLAGSDEIVGLLHRPYPEGKTAQTVLEDIDTAIVDAWLGRLSAAAGRAVLQHLLEVYELGKPLAENPQTEAIRKHVHQAP